MKPFFKNRQKLITACVGVVAILALLLPFAFAKPATATLQAGKKTYALNIAASTAAQQKGLGGRKSLARNRGMLFVFDAPATQCFWMKDMQFPIDIIWLNSDKQVTRVAANVSPDTYTEASGKNSQKFCGDVSTKYVIELNAGEAKQAGLVVGQPVSL